MGAPDWRWIVKRSEAAALLTLVASFDNRKPDEAAAMAWADALDGLRPQDCAEAIRQHFRESREWLMPVDVRRRVGKIRAERVARHVPVTPPVELDVLEGEAFDRAYLAWHRGITQRIADGEVIEQREPLAISMPDYARKALGPLAVVLDKAALVAENQEEA